MFNFLQSKITKKEGLKMRKIFTKGIAMIIILVMIIMSSTSVLALDATDPTTPDSQSTTMAILSGDQPIVAPDDQMAILPNDSIIGPQGDGTAPQELMPMLAASCGGGADFSTTNAAMAYASSTYGFTYSPTGSSYTCTPGTWSVSLQGGCGAGGLYVLLTLFKNGSYFTSWYCDQR